MVRFKAFTLIELLIVVAVIALLIAILLPGLRGVRVYANGMICQANLSQLAKAWRLYLDAYDGGFYQNNNTDTSLNYGGWKGVTSDNSVPPPRPLNPFVALPVDLGSDLPGTPDWTSSQTTMIEEKAKIFCCPSDNGGVPDETLTCFQWKGTSYQTNIFLVGQMLIYKGTGRLAPLNGEINKRLRRMNENRAYDPAHLILMGDYGWVNQWRPGIPFKTEWHRQPAYHNVGFLDGHVEMIQIHKGLFITPSYRVLPFEDLNELALSVQQEEP